MPKKSTKAAGNVFYEARLVASSWNDKLNSREGASEETGIDRTRIAHIELGTINPHPEEVLILADCYNAPELHNFYCSSLCPLGKQTILPVHYTELEKATLQLISSLQGLPDIKSCLISIASVGEIGEQQQPRMEEILTYLDVAAVKIKALQLYYKKHYGDWRKSEGNRRRNVERK